MITITAIPNTNYVLTLLKEVCKESKAILVIATHDKRVKDQFEKQLVL
jgi:ABC-type lipoprotein export system ATPase subunit